jgi:hypothetical protein
VVRRSSAGGGAPHTIYGECRCAAASRSLQNREAGSGAERSGERSGRSRATTANTEQRKKVDWIMQRHRTENGAKQCSLTAQQHSTRRRRQHTRHKSTEQKGKCYRHTTDGTGQAEQRPLPFGRTGGRRKQAEAEQSPLKTPANETESQSVNQSIRPSVCRLDHF